MPHISGLQLTIMRRQVTESLPDICEILESDGTSSDSGGEVDTWPSARSYPCDVKPLQPIDELEKGGKMTAVGLYIVTLPWNATLTAEDRLRVTSSEDGSVAIFEVQEPGTNVSNQVATNVRARLVQ